MIVLYALVALLVRRSSRHHGIVPKQDDLLLSMAVAPAIAMLLATLNTSFDYVYVCFFLISATTLLSIRWWVGVFFLGPLVAAACCWRGIEHLPPDATTHLLVAWGCGVMLSYKTDYCRRQVFAHQHRVNAAHKREIDSMAARRNAEGDLAVLQSEEASREKQMEEKSELVRVMCHEVRTPLNSCLASAEMLLDTPLQDEQREHAQTIRVSGSILLSTVSTFLDYFKLEAGRQLELGLTEVNLPALLSQLHSIIRAMIGTSSEVDLKTPRMTDVPEVIVTDPVRLQGVILNLYTNAAKCTQRGFIDLKVRVINRSYTVPPGLEYSQVMVTPSYPRGAFAGLNKTGWQGQKLTLKQKFMRERPSIDCAITTSQTEWKTEIPKLETSAGSIALRARDLEVPSCARNSEETVREGHSLQRTDMVNDGVQESSHPKWLLFEVSDSGMGISSDQLNSLFQEYATVDTSSHHPKPLAGTGLGLSICSKQVDLLGGRIGAYSKLDTGSVFWFTIPLIKEAEWKKVPIRRRASWTAGSVGDVQPRGHNRSTAGNTPTTGDDVWRPPEPGSSDSTSGPMQPIVQKTLDTSVLQGRRVLLAEDDVISQNVTRRMLMAYGMKCTVVSNGRDAVNLVAPNGTQEAAFDVVLMDMLMPKMGGIKATQEIRNKGVSVPIIAMTANALDRDWEECKAAGMDAFLSKPVGRGSMAEALVCVSKGKRPV